MTTDQTSITWPPHYTLKKSGRARHVKLKASVRHGLELVVPMRFNQKHIPEILESNKSWIIKQLAKLHEQLKNAPTLPDEIHLPAINQLWKIFYLKANNKKLSIISRPQQELVLLGEIENSPLCKKMLTQWIKETAKNYLISRLQDLSEKTRLPYQRAVIRGQRSRWGSCSTNKIINLNYKLLFLPAHLADHIIIHELCHTVHMNHSTKFWRLVSTHDKNWKEHTCQVRQAEALVPAWLEYDSPRS